jgi:hypothetical protein
MNRRKFCPNDVQLDLFHTSEISMTRTFFGYAVLTFASLFLLSGCGGSNGVGSGGGGNGGGGGSAPAPVLTQLSPSHATTRAPVGIAVITGRNFTSNSSVLFDGNPVRATVRSASSIELFIDSSTYSVAQLHTVQVSDSSGGKVEHSDL